MDILYGIGIVACSVTSAYFGWKFGYAKGNRDGHKVGYDHGVSVTINANKSAIFNYNKPKVMYGAKKIVSEKSKPEEVWIG
jgi:hypothetical protein